MTNSKMIFDIYIQYTPRLWNIYGKGGGKKSIDEDIKNEYCRIEEDVRRKYGINVYERVMKEIDKVAETVEEMHERKGKKKKC